jgi:phosphoglycerate kinase
MGKIQFIDDKKIKNKRILLRVDFNVTLTEKFKIADDQRIRQSIPTINKLYKNNKLILVAHLDRPEKRDKKYSLGVVVKRLREYLPDVRVALVDDFLDEKGRKQLSDQKNGEILFLENIRFYKGEEKNDLEFATRLSEIADIYVNDAFGVAHRVSASVVGVAKLLPSFGGLLLKKEIEVIENLLKDPKHPLVAIIGGSKVSTKFELLHKLTKIADVLILGGGIANTFLAAKGFPIGKSLSEKNMEREVEKIISEAKKHGTKIVLPEDVAVGDKNNHENGGAVRKVEDVKSTDVILDVGPEAMAQYAKLIGNAQTIVWNGPVGYIENDQFKRGTDFLYYSIANNDHVTSIVGGGDTIAAISKKEYLDNITHISTGGGAMLEFIEKGTLPGIEALKR